MNLATSFAQQRCTFVLRQTPRRAWKHHAFTCKLQTPAPPPFSTRVVSQMDLSALVLIDQACGSSTNHKQFQEEMNRECSIVLVGEAADAAVAGYVLAWHVLDELQIFDVAVHPRHRRQGLARQLLLALLNERVGKVITAMLEVRPGNAAAIALYEQLGFLQVGRRKGYYQDGEDAILMNMDIPSPSTAALPQLGASLL